MTMFRFAGWRSSHQGWFFFFFGNSFVWRISRMPGKSARHRQGACVIIDRRQSDALVTVWYYVLLLFLSSSKQSWNKEDYLKYILLFRFPSWKSWETLLPKDCQVWGRFQLDVKQRDSFRSFCRKKRSHRRSITEKCVLVKNLKSTSSLQEKFFVK